MTKPTLKQFIDQAKEIDRRYHLKTFGEMVEQLATELHTMGLPEPVCYDQFNRGIAVVGAMVAARHEIVDTGELHLMLDTPDLGCVWVVYWRPS